MERRSTWLRPRRCVGNDSRTGVQSSPESASSVRLSLSSPSCQDLNPNFFLAGVEITSDTPWGGQWFKQLADARIIITTPEKYDSITRWFVRPLTLFLIGRS